MPYFVYSKFHTNKWCIGCSRHLPITNRCGKDFFVPIKIFDGEESLNLNNDPYPIDSRIIVKCKLLNWKN